jgi:hypothetical protein
VAAKASAETAITGISAVCQGSYGNLPVENIRLAVINAPVAAAAGVAARSFHMISASNALNPSDQITTAADSVAHSKHESSTPVPAKGSTASNTIFDCHDSFS